MRPIPWQYFFIYLTFVIVCGYANGGSIARRDTNDNGDDNALSRYVDRLINASKSLPVIGEDVSGILEWCVQAVSLFEIGTNGALARFIGGALPCTVALNGTTCSGLTNNGGFAKILMNTLDGVPSIILPGFVKALISLFIQLFVDPTVDVLFGGVVVPT